MNVTWLVAFIVFALQTPTPSAIEGVVLDATDSQPLAGVQLTLPLRAGPPVTVTSDAEGRFEFAQIPAGSYRISTSKDGYAPAYADGRNLPGNAGIPVTVKAGGPVRGLQIHLHKGAVVTGRVFDTVGRPAVRVAVSLMRKVYDDNGVATMAATNSATTDDRGEFRIFGVRGGSYEVVADSVSMPIAVRSGEEARLRDLTVPLIKSAPIRLRIENQTGETPAMMVIEVRKDGVTNRNIAIPMPSDTYTLNSMTPGTYDIGVGLMGSDGFLFSHVEAKVGDQPGETPLESIVKVNKGWRISGKVDLLSRTGSFRPIAGVQTILGRPGSADTQSATSAVDGSFVLTGATEGPRRVRVEGLPLDSYIVSVEEYDVDILKEGIRVAGDTSIHVVVGEAGGSIDGNVFASDESKIADAIVVLVPDELPSRTAFYRTANTDQNGAFTLRGIAPGAYHLFAWRELEGAAYRNAEFMKAFQDQGMALKIEAGSHLSLDVKTVK